MSRACWTVCAGCTHKYCEFCFRGDKREKVQYEEESEVEVEDNEDEDEE